MQPRPTRTPRRDVPRRARSAAVLLSAIAAAAMLAGCSGGSSSTAQGPSAAEGSAAGRASGSGFAGAALPAGIVAPGFDLTDQRGRRVTLADYRGHVVMISFVYSSCGPACVLVAQQIRGALDQLAGRVPVLLISAEPAADTSASVARFLAAVSLQRRAEYLTGPRGQLAALWRAYRITPPSTSRSDFRRAASVLLVDRAGYERVLFGLEQLTPESLAHDVETLDGQPVHP